MTLNISKKWDFILFFLFILVVVSVSALVDKVLVVKEKEDNIGAGKTVDEPISEGDDQQDLTDKNKDGATKKEEQKKDNVLHDAQNKVNNNNKDSSGSEKGQDSIPEELELLNLWFETLEENGISKEFIKDHIEVKDYKKVSVNDKTTFKVYITYSIDWVKIDIIFPVPLETEISLASNQQVSSKADKIKKTILKNINIFRNRTIVTQERYANMVKDTCFPTLNISNIGEIKPEFRIFDNYLTALYWDYLSNDENKCALSTVNLEDEENVCKPVPCIKLQFVA
jgi:hypothetical protein